jgi:tetratricopeptide (TPR) repeat protein
MTRVPPPRALFAKGSELLQKNEVDGALKLAVAAERAFRLSGDVNGWCAARSLVGRIHLRCGRLLDARAAFSEVAEQAARLRIEARELAALTELGAVCELEGDLREAIATHRTVLERQRARGDDVGVAVAAGNVGRMLPRLAPGHDATVVQDQESDARALLEESGRLFHAAGHKEGAVNALICLGDFERACGNLTAAEQALEAGVQLSLPPPPTPLHAVAWLNLGHVRRDRGRLDDAQEAFGRSREVAGQCRDTLAVARADLALALAASETRTPAEAVALFSDVETAFEALGQQGGALTARVNRAVLLARTGRLIESAELLHATRATLQRHGDRRAVLEIGLALAELSLARGMAQAALEELVAVRAATNAGDRLAVRMRLIEARLHLRHLELSAAAAAVASKPVAELSSAEAFSCDLLRADIASWQQSPAARPLLADLDQRAQATGGARDQAAVMLAAAGEALWSGDLQRCRASATAAQARFARLGEALARADAQLLLWYVDLAHGVPVAAQSADGLYREVRAAGAMDLARSVATFDAARTLQAGQGDAAAVVAAADAQAQAGHSAGQVASLCFATLVTTNMHVHESARTALARHDLPMPGLLLPRAP